jgi:hypothetical protein
MTVRIRARDALSEVEAERLAVPGAVRGDPGELSAFQHEGPILHRERNRLGL